MKRNHRAIFVTALAVSMLSLPGCMNTGDRAMVTESPTAQSTAQPLTNDAGAMGDNPANDANRDLGQSSNPNANRTAAEVRSAFDWVGNVNSATDELNRISEIDRSYIVVDGDDAIVGLTFDASYRGGLDERIISMVRQKLVTLDPALEDIEVTAEPEQVKLIQALADKLAGGATIDQLESEFDNIENQIESSNKAANRATA